MSNRASAQNEPTTMDSTSYSLGVLMAQSLKDQGVSGLNWEQLTQGIADVLEDRELKISVMDANTRMQEYFKGLQAKRFESIIQAGEQFLAENGQRAEVTTLESGLQYEILQEGDGPIPADTNRVTVHYTGKLLDGTVFDSSVERGQPATFGVTQVIKGWVEALQLMPKGSKWRLFIPYDLAYGERGAGQKIPPYSMLIFDVELLEIE
jgi:FKBP-type peptidyl-prolyl cis-trans isomerase FklB